jgi:hypothetical protein
VNPAAQGERRRRWEERGRDQGPGRSSAMATAASAKCNRAPATRLVCILQGHPLPANPPAFFLQGLHYSKILILIW